MSEDARSLRIDFESEDDFRREYRSNIANGGMFVATNAGFTVREPVRIDVVLGWCDRSISLTGEIVHVVTPEQAGVGSSPGVAVQFSVRASDLRERFERELGDLVSENELDVGKGKRTARRARARVPVLIRTTAGREIEGRSRDVSTTGTLVGIDARPVDIGEVVQLVISNPTTAEEVEVHGTVMRHVLMPGTRVALGIRFEVPESEADQVGAFLRALQVAEHSRRLGGISGPIAEIGIENVLQVFGACSRKGMLTLNQGDDEGYVAFEDGMLRGVQLGDTYGRKALSRLLAWGTGTFEFQARTEPSLYQGDPMPLDAAMLDALRLLDESRMADSRVLPAGAKLRVDREKFEAAGVELSQAEEAILDLAAVGMSVGKVIDVIPEPDEEIRQQLCGLIARGLIRLEE